MVAHDESDPFAWRKDGANPVEDDALHAHRARCRTDPSRTLSLEAVVDVVNGSIPLWAPGITLRWRFNEESMAHFERPDAAKARIRHLIDKSLRRWGDAAPVGLREREDDWDFEVVARRRNDCDDDGCTLASAFFPGKSQEQLLMFPRMFLDPEEEQVATLVHEFGHVFGLRHYFAATAEPGEPSVVFGHHRKQTIMNYGEDSVLTPQDRSDLKRLYEQVWSGRLDKIRGIPVRLVRPHHASGAAA